MIVCGIAYNRSAAFDFSNPYSVLFLKFIHNIIEDLGFFFLLTFRWLSLTMAVKVGGIS